MFDWFNRRKRTRREEDIRHRMTEAIEKKEKVAKESLEKLRQFNLGRRRDHAPYEGHDRRIARA